MTAPEDKNDVDEAANPDVFMQEASERLISKPANNPDRKWFFSQEWIGVVLFCDKLIKIAYPQSLFRIHRNDFYEEYAEISQ